MYCTGFSPICIIIIIITILMIIMRFLLTEMSHVTLQEADEKAADID